MIDWCVGADVCPAAPCVASNATGKIHAVRFRAVFGLHDNWYHFFYGRLAGFVTWLRRHVDRDDAVVFVEEDFRKQDKWLPGILKQVVSPGLCVRTAFVVDDVEKDGARWSDFSGKEWMIWPRERGYDLLLYGCGTLRRESLERIGSELEAAQDALRRLCSCCEPPDPERRVVVILDRGRRDPHRTIPNMDAIQAALETMFDDDESVTVRRSNHVGRSPCEQWCAAYRSTVLVGQHGAGLASAAFLRGAKAGLVEIRPTIQHYKSMYQCISRLRGSHYARLEQNSSHSAVDPEPVVAAVRDIFDMVGHPSTLEFPKTRLSRHMMTMKCSGDANVLVRSGECPPAVFERTASCFIDDDLPADLPASPIGTSARESAVDFIFAAARLRTLSLYANESAFG
ncbi:hypothetical protein CTAYLR_001355 [Chrysophaeum taylorii]|uniref:Uncharacterized protein n=1 Tax=Chrysophaeum taylorii TaxID=2483200 RepID=A0AAD7U735_9STRA|nr:hypothetical protein CTAYLR_001355 [Chrysophaeum taylorii]